jgi:hypothetical protein
MAKSRLHMETSDGAQAVEMPDTPMGRGFLVGLRIGRPDMFRHQRIKSVIQMQPSNIPVGVLVNTGR